MKYKTFENRIVKLVEKTAEKKRDIMYQNTNEAFYIVPDGYSRAYYFYRLEGFRFENYVIGNTLINPNAREADALKMISEKAERTAELAEKTEERIQDDGTVLVKYSTRNGERENYFNEKLLKKFPDNALLYLPTGKWEPAIICMEDVDRFVNIGGIVPVRVF